MSHVLCGYLFSRASNTIDSFDPFNIFQANRLSAKPPLFRSLTYATTFGMALALERDAMLRINCEAVMWKITTRGFTLEEANYGYDRTTQVYFGSTPARVQSDIHQITGAAVVKLPGFARIQPYALAGGGALVFNPTGNVGNSFAGASEQTRGAFLYGVGADYVLAKHWSLRAEYRGLVYKAPSFNLAGLDTDSWTHSAQPSAGIVFRF